MNSIKTKKLVLASILCAIGVMGSFFSIPVLGSKCAPVQHMVNIICAVILGPLYGVVVAFVTSLLRNMLGLGTLMAFPGSMFGALLAGIVFSKTKNTWLTYGAEVFGTAILGGLFAYPIAIFIMGKNPADIAFYVYIVPFFISTLGGAIISAIIIENLKKVKNLNIFETQLIKK